MAALGWLSSRTTEHPTPPLGWEGSTQNVEEVEAARPTLMGQNTVEATDQNFSDLINGETPVLVDFWAEWCGPCKMMNGPLEELAGEHAGDLSIAKLNVDENQQTAMNYEVMSIPTMIIFKDGVEKKRLVGARSKSQLENELTEYVG